MGVGEHGRVKGGEVARAERGVADGAFHRPPAVVAAAPDHVDLLPEPLPHVAQPEVPGGAVEGELPGVAEAVGVDLASLGAVGVREGVVRGDAIRLALGHAVHVDPEKRSEGGVQPLPSVHGVVAGAAVAERDVEVAVGAEGDLPAVVVGERLGHLQEHPLAGGVGREGVARGPRQLGDHAAPVRARGVVHEDAAVGLVVRVEREPEQAALAARPHAVVEVHEHRRRGVSGHEGDDARAPAARPLLHDVRPLRLPGRDGEFHGGLEADAGESVQGGDLGARRRAQPHGERDGHRQRPQREG